MKRIRIERILTDKKSLMLSYDQGLEHGPIDFDAHNIDPNYIIYIAVNGEYNGLILQKGIAETYYENYYKKVPLILKLNGKSNIPRIFPVAKQNCSVKRAVDLGADAVGYTIYVGSPLEPEIFREFGKIQEEAHDYGLPVIAWMHPKGRFITNETSTSMLSYAARIGLELGADMIHLNYNDNKEEFKWIIRCAGMTKVCISDGTRIADSEFLRRLKDIMETGAIGISAGLNVWQHQTPMKMTAAIKKIIFEDSSVEEALSLLR